MRNYVALLLMVIPVSGFTIGLKSDLISAHLWGGANAGSTVSHEAHSTYLNPAALIGLDRPQISASGIWHYSNTRLGIDNATYSYSSTQLPGLPIVKRPQAHYGVGNLSMAMPISESWSIGLAVVSPYNYKSYYKVNDPSRYDAVLFSLKSYQLTPAIAYKLTEILRFGIGFDCQWSELHFKNQFGFPDATDGYINVRADKWTMGYHLGAVLKPTEDFQMGCSYFSKFKINMQGSAELANPSAPFPTNPGIQPSQSAQVGLKLPESLVYSVKQQLDERWGLMADLEFTHWARLRHLTIKLDNGQLLEQVFEFKNTMRVAFGGHYIANERWRLLAGVAWEQSPVNFEYRGLLVPDRNQFWTNIGVRYSWCNLMLDAAYGYGWPESKHFNAPQAELSGPGTAPLVNDLTGCIKVQQHVLGIQLTIKL